jgi:Zn finger protein HypA/HybF involved in hydrogenase expression
MSYYEGDPFSNHVLNEIKCGECEQEYDEQEGEGNVCPTCIDKEEGESERDSNINTERVG